MKAKKKSVNAGVKGKRGELELANQINILTDGKFCPRRRLNQSRDGGYDLDGCGNYKIEVKRHKSYKYCDLKKWWRQIATTSDSRLPVVAFRGDREPWSIMFHDSRSYPETDFRGCVRIGLDLFCHYLLHPEENHVKQSQ